MISAISGSAWNSAALAHRGADVVRHRGELAAHQHAVDDEQVLVEIGLLRIRHLCGVGGRQLLEGRDELLVVEREAGAGVGNRRLIRDQLQRRRLVGRQCAFQQVDRVQPHEARGRIVVGNRRRADQGSREGERDKDTVFHDCAPCP